MSKFAPTKALPSTQALRDRDPRAWLRLERISKAPFHNALLGKFGRLDDQRLADLHAEALGILFCRLIDQSKTPPDYPIGFLIGTGQRLLQNQFSRRRYLLPLPLLDQAHPAEAPFLDRLVQEDRLQRLRRLQGPCKTILRKFYLDRYSLEALRRYLQETLDIHYTEGSLRVKRRKCFEQLQQLGLHHGI